MPISLRIPSGKENLIKLAAKKAGKSKTAFILDAVDEKIGLAKNREQTIKNLSGWLSEEEASQMKSDLEVFDVVNEADWQ